MSEFLAPVHLLLLLSVAVFYILPFWFIFKKAGFSPLISLLMFVPVANVIMLYVLAFSAWKPDRSSPPSI